ncbi:MAG: MerC domain-containing protein [Cognaticolwellia sp.]
MTEFQQPADKIAISLSILCAIHCFATPMLIVLFPAIASLFFSSELLHMWMVVAVLPVSVLALTLGCKKHCKFQVALVGGIGLIFMLIAVASGALGFGEMLEKALTLVGAALISIAHYWNYRQCQTHTETQAQAQSCDCH